MRYLPFFLLLTTITAASCQFGRFVWYNFADIQDYRRFPSRPLTAVPEPFTFQQAVPGRAPRMIEDPDRGHIPFDTYLEDQHTVAFLIIQHDSVQYERYFRGYADSSIVASFSMAKSVTSILIGCAIADGLIGSVDDPITRYLPEMKSPGMERVTLRHLLQMTSGIRFNESYVNPFGDAADFYYGRNLPADMSRLRMAREPGTDFEYISGNTQILGWVLARVLKAKTITQYLQEKIWTPLGMEYDASWSLDRKQDGLEKTFCCLNARARDFAKIGRLYLHQGNWQGQQLVPADWVTASTRADTSAGGVSYYGYQWWLPSGEGDFMAEGILGQFIYVHPAKDLIIVRLGQKTGKADWWQLFRTLAEAY
jgi:CubicO group peptidase (beta-lactamase class C family)